MNFEGTLFNPVEELITLNPMAEKGGGDTLKENQGTPGLRTGLDAGYHSAHFSLQHVSHVCVQLCLHTSADGGITTESGSLLHRWVIFRG